MIEPTSEDATEVKGAMPESQDMTASVEPDASEEYSGACIPVPESLKASLSEGSAFDGKITGTVVMKDGMLQVEVETLNDEPVEGSKSPSEEGANEYTGKSGEDMDMSGPEALVKFMKGRKVTQ